MSDTTTTDGEQTAPPQESLADLIRRANGLAVETEATRTARLAAAAAEQAAIDAADNTPDVPVNPIDNTPVEPGLVDVARVYADLRRRQEAAEGEGKGYKKLADEIEARLVEQMDEAQLQNLKIRGVGTVYRRRTVFGQWIPGLGQERQIELLRAAGAGELIKEGFNANTFNAWVREFEKDGRPLPEALTEFLTFGEKLNVGVRK